MKIAIFSLTIFLPYTTLLAHALRIHLEVFTTSPTVIRRNINDPNGLFAGTDAQAEGLETIYTLNTPITEVYNCQPLRKNIGTDPQNPGTIITGLGLWYSPSINDYPNQRYDEPIAIALWKRQPSWKELWYGVLKKLGKINPLNPEHGTFFCMGKPDILLTFHPRHEMAELGWFGENFVMMPSDMEWLKDYEDFMLVGASDDDDRYKVWSKTVEKKLVAKRFGDWLLGLPMMQEIN